MQSKLSASGCPERNRERGSWRLKHSDRAKSHQIGNQITARIIKLPYQNFIESSCQSEGTIYGGAWWWWFRWCFWFWLWKVQQTVWREQTVWRQQTFNWIPFLENPANRTSELSRLAKMALAALNTNLFPFFWSLNDKDRRVHLAHGHPHPLVHRWTLNNILCTPFWP